MTKKQETRLPDPLKDCEFYLRALLHLKMKNPRWYRAYVYYTECVPPLVARANLNKISKQGYYHMVNKGKEIISDYLKLHDSIIIHDIAKTIDAVYYPEMNAPEFFDLPAAPP